MRVFGPKIESDRAEDEHRGRGEAAQSEREDGGVDEEQRRPQAGDHHVDDEKDRAGGFGGEGGARIVGGPWALQRDADQRGETEAGEGQPQGRAGEEGGRR